MPTNVRWTAPEVLKYKKEDKSVTSVDDGKRADVYSFAVLMFEVGLPYCYSKVWVYIPSPRLPRQVLSGTSPFPKDSDEEVVDKVTTGMRPEWAPEYASRGLEDPLWELIEVCWIHDPEERPTALTVLQTLQAIGEERPQESQEPPAHIDEDTWHYVEVTPESSTFGFCGGG